MGRLLALALVLLIGSLALWLAPGAGADGPAALVELAPGLTPNIDRVRASEEHARIDVLAESAPRDEHLVVAPPEPASDPQRIDATDAPDWLPDDRDFYHEGLGPEYTVYNEDGTPAYQAEQVQLPNGQWVREGDWRAWHENGQVNEVGAYKGDEEHGQWDWYYENGQPQATGSWDEGKRFGAWVFWYENGQKMMDGSYVNGNGTGEWTHYHDNGVLRAQGTMLDGEIDGYWTFWSSDGSVEEDRTGTYEGGVLVD